MIHGWEWIIILVIILLLLGPSKIPGLARALGKSVSEFRSGSRGNDKDGSDSTDENKPEVKEAGKT